jgi:hypothetical protein
MEKHTMHLLPKANPLKEHLPANRALVTNILKKLGDEKFTGYLNLNAPGFDAFCIFSQGNMVSVISTENLVSQTGFDAFEQMFEKVLSTDSMINIYRMTPDLVMCAHALVHGEKLFNSEVIRQIDMKAIFAELKDSGLNGVVRFSADNRTAMLFFKGGNPLGFYTDGSKNIDTSPEESRKVAAMPGALLDVFSINPEEDVITYDLLHMFDIESIWEEATRKLAAAATQNTQTAPPPDNTVTAPETTEPTEVAVPESVAAPVSTTSEAFSAEPEPPTQETAAPPGEDDLQALVEDLKDVAVAYLSKSGGPAVEKMLENAGGPSIFYSRDDTERFLGMLLMESLKIDDHARIEEMLQLMRSEIEERVHNRI